MSSKPSRNDGAVRETNAKFKGATSASKARSLRQIALQKIRVGLEKPNFDRDFEFSVDAPGRVIVRLERLMGTDRIKITDMKYMATLLSRLEEEEDDLWKKRTWERRKAEHNRYRQLVINGYTEPGPGMEDLMNHPIFRVNRIVNRLLKISAATTPILQMPPINPVEPFEDDDTGAIFKSYPGHISSAQELELMSQSTSQFGLLKKKQSLVRRRSTRSTNRVHIKEDSELDESKIGEDDLQGTKSALAVMSEADEEIHNSVQALLAASRQSSSLKRVSMKQDHYFDEETTQQPDKTKQKEGSISLSDIQKKYGVAPNTDLGVQWKPYRSELVKPIFADEVRGVRDLYEMGTKIVEVYEREQITADEYIDSMIPDVISVDDLPPLVDVVDIEGDDLEPESSEGDEDSFESAEYWNLLRKSRQSRAYQVLTRIEAPSHREESTSEFEEDYEDYEGSEDEYNEDEDDQFSSGDVDDDDDGYDAEG